MKDTEKYRFISLVATTIIYGAVVAPITLLVFQKSPDKGIFFIVCIVSGLSLLIANLAMFPVRMVWRVFWGVVAIHLAVILICLL